MDGNQILKVLEEATGLALDEKALEAMVDKKLKSLLEAVPARKVLLGESPAQAVGFSRYLGDIRRVGMGQGPRYLSEGELVSVSSPELAVVKDLREGAGSAGGYLVPQEQADEVLKLVDRYSPLKALCRQVPMASAQITFPTVGGGLAAYWVPEASATEGLSPDGSHQADGEVPRSEPTFGQLPITAHVLAVKVVVSNQLLDDSDPGVDRVLMELFAETIAQALDIACLRGGGTTTDPITGLAGLITTNALSVDGSFDFDDVAELIFSVYEHAPHAPQVPVLAHPKAEKQLMKLKDADGNYIYRHPGQASDGDNRPRIWGEPLVREPNILTNLGTDSNLTRLFAGDFATSGFIGIRQGLVIRTNPWAEPYFSFNQTAFLALVRVGFAVSDEKRFAKLEGVPTS